MADVMVRVAKSSMEIQQRRMQTLEKNNAALQEELAKLKKQTEPGDNSGIVNAELVLKNSALESELAAVKAALAAGPKKEKKIISVGQKGGIVVDLGGRFPFTQYQENMLRILDLRPMILAFIAANNTKLKEKPTNE